MSTPAKFDASNLMEELRQMYVDADPAHDFSHALRVYRNALLIGEPEGADMQVLLLSALLHDAGEGSKTGGAAGRCHPLAGDYLRRKGFLEGVIEGVLYAIDVHRFSGGVTPKTLEGKILQDADRLDAIGAIGIARVFMTGGSLGRGMYSPVDPFCRSREPNDKRWNLDHFYKKLLKLEAGMHTETARRMAARRGEVLRKYLEELEEEIMG